jgi:hypothetical protein
VEAVTKIGLSVRAGVHTGECERIGEKLSGVAVHIGARVCGEAGRSEVLVSSTVRDLLAGSGLAFADRGLRSLRGIPGDWRVYTLERPGDDDTSSAWIQLCGRVAIELDGRRVEHLLPGRQGQLLFVYLAQTGSDPSGAMNDGRALAEPTAQDRGFKSQCVVVEAASLPWDPRLDGRSTLQLQLPERSWVDIEAAMGNPPCGVGARAEIGRRHGRQRVTLHIAGRPFLRRGCSVGRRSAPQTVGCASVRSRQRRWPRLAIGGSELNTAQRCSRTLIIEAPYRESGYRMLMEVLARRKHSRGVTGL